MNYGISLLSIIPMRKEPQEQSEMVSQLLFGECYGVLAETDGWIRILTQFDNYTGWIDGKLYVEFRESCYKEFSEQYPPVLSSMLMNIESSGALPLSILAGSTLPGYNEKKELLTIDQNEFRIHWIFGDTQTKGPKTLPIIAGMFLNAPYLWGGRTLFGCDCSGFVQSVYKIMGIALPRDASQQANQGIAINSLTEAQQGDLAFFANDEEKVYHVGLILSPDEIIHCSGYVRKDRLDETGIYNSGINKYTHQLFTVRRLIL
jgi:hypothetical protein